MSTIEPPVKIDGDPRQRAAVSISIPAGPKQFIFRAVDEGGDPECSAHRYVGRAAGTAPHPAAGAQIRLLGAFAISVDGEVVPERGWRLRKAKSLVKLLALAPEHRVHRERATELLWPERAPAAAANNFHQALYVARRALAMAGADVSAVLPLRDDMLALYPSGRVEVDINVFEAAVAHARDTGDLPDYRAALGLYGGELLPEDRYEGWAVSRREASNEAHLGLRLELSARLDEDGNAPAAIEVLKRAVVIDPLHEAAHRALMRLFAAAGRRQQALAQYHQLREALRRDLEAEPDPQTGRLYRTLLRGEVDSHTPEPKLRLQTARPAGRRPAEPARHSLPTALTSLIGRDRELWARLSRTRPGRFPVQSSRSSATPSERPIARSSITTTAPGHHGCRGLARWANRGQLH